MPIIEMLSLGAVDEDEARDRGYLSHILVEIDQQQLYPVLFYDPVRLAQDLAADAEHGEPFLAEPGMIVLPQIRIELMRNAVAELQKVGFFDRMVPVDWEYLRKANRYSWPPMINGEWEWGEAVRGLAQRLR